VIEAFLSSWELFGATWIVGLLVAAVLSVVGVWIVARDQIFLGAAVAQASTLGVALALFVGGAAADRLHWLESGAATATLAVAASVATAWLAARVAEGRAESHEAVTGWIFLLAASVPVLMLARSPHGLEEVQRLVFSTLLSVSANDLGLFAVLAAATAAVAILLRERLLAFALDPEFASAVGLRGRAWNAAVAIWLGVAVGLSIRVAGTIYTFGCLVLPPLVAKNLCREVGPMLWVAPSVAVLAALAGFVLSNGLDLPPAHATVGLLAAALPVAWAWRALRAAYPTRAP
jgi:ABC-type Mn2+/Zn2+ transport system permease subunit